MTPPTSFEVSRLIRSLRDQAGLTQRELADRVSTTQSVISRLESDDYDGHSLSMLYRIAAALNRRIAVTAVGDDALGFAVKETAPAYGSGAVAGASDEGGADEGLSSDELERLAGRLALRLRHRGVTEPEAREAIRWARGTASRAAVEKLRGAIRVGPGDIAADVRRARARRGRERVTHP